MGKITSQAKFELNPLPSRYQGMSKGLVSDQGMHIPDLDLIEGRNIMPFADGITSYFGKTYPLPGSMQGLQEIISYQTIHGIHLLIALCADGIYIRSLAGDAAPTSLVSTAQGYEITLNDLKQLEWTQVITNDSADRWKLWTYTIIDNRLFLYQPNLGYIAWIEDVSPTQFNVRKSFPTYISTNKDLQGFEIRAVQDAAGTSTVQTITINGRIYQVPVDTAPDRYIAADKWEAAMRADNIVSAYKQTLSSTDAAGEISGSLVGAGAVPFTTNGTHPLNGKIEYPATATGKWYRIDLNSGGTTITILLNGIAHSFDGALGLHNYINSNGPIVWFEHATGDFLYFFVPGENTIFDCTTHTWAQLAYTLTTLNYNDLLDIGANTPLVGHGFITYTSIGALSTVNPPVRYNDIKSPIAYNTGAVTLPEFNILHINLPRSGSGTWTTGPVTITLDGTENIYQRIKKFLTALLDAGFVYDPTCVSVDGGGAIRTRNSGLVIPVDGDIPGNADPSVPGVVDSVAITVPVWGTGVTDPVFPLASSVTNFSWGTIYSYADKIIYLYLPPLDISYRIFSFINLSTDKLISKATLPHFKVTKTELRYVLNFHQYQNAPALVGGKDSITRFAGINFDGNEQPGINVFDLVIPTALLDELSVIASSSTDAQQVDALIQKFLDTCLLPFLDQYGANIGLTFKAIAPKDEWHQWTLNTSYRRWPVIILEYEGPGLPEIFSWCPEQDTYPTLNFIRDGEYELLGVYPLRQLKPKKLGFDGVTTFTYSYYNAYDITELYINGQTISVPQNSEATDIAALINSQPDLAGSVKATNQTTDRDIKLKLATTNTPLSIAIAQDGNNLFTLTQTQFRTDAYGVVAGIFNARGRLGAWTYNNKIHWSSSQDPFDFTPSISTKANEVTVKSVLGNIIRCVGYENGFMIYSTGNANRAVYTGKQFIFEFDPVEGSGGCIDPRHVAWKSDAHFVWTEQGLQLFDPLTGRVSNQFAELHEYITSNRYPIQLSMLGNRYLTFGLQGSWPSFSYQAQRDGRVDDVTVGDATLVIPPAGNVTFIAAEYGANLYPTYTKTLLYDLLLKRFGTLDHRHKCIYSLSPINQLGILPEKDFTGANEGYKTYNMGLAFVDDTHSHWLATANTTDSYAVFGKYAVHRMDHTKLVGIQSEYAEAPEAVIEVERSKDGQYVYSRTVADTPRKVLSFRHLLQAGRWFNIIVKGRFKLTRLLVSGYRQQRHR